VKLGDEGLQFSAHTARRFIHGDSKKSGTGHC